MSDTDPVARTEDAIVETLFRAPLSTSARLAMLYRIRDAVAEGDAQSTITEG